MVSPGEGRSARRHWGVAMRLWAGLAVLALLAVTASLVGRLAVTAYQSAFHENATVALPSLVAASQLAQLAQSTIASAPALALADTQPVRRAAQFRIQDELGWLKDLVDKLGRSGQEGELVATASRLRTELSQTLDILGQQVEDRIDLTTKLNQAIQRLSGLEQTVSREALALLHELNQFPDDVRRLGKALDDWSLAEQRSLTLLALAASATEPAELQRLQSEIAGTLETAAKVLTPLPPAQTDRLSELHRRIESLSTGEDSVFALKLRRLAIGKAVRDTMIHNKELSDEFVTVVAAAATAIQTEVLEHSEQLNRRAEFQSELLFGMAMLCVIGALTTLLYINRNVIRRLRELVGCMRSMVSGNQGIRIPTAAEDEIGDLGRAFQFFVDAIQAREADLRENRRLLDAVVDAAPVQIAVTDRNHRLILINRFEAAFLGTEPEQALGRTAAELINLPYGKITAFQNSLVLNGGTPQLNLEETHRDRRGQELRLLTSKVPLIDESGAASHVVTVALDITARKHAEDALKSAKAQVESIAEAVRQRNDQLTSLLDNSGQGFLSFGENLVVNAECSRACEDMLGLNPAGCEAAEVLFGGDQTKATLLRSVVDEARNVEEPWTRDLMLSLLPGEYQRDDRMLKAEYKILDNNDMMVVLTDITEARRLEQRLETERRHLELVVSAVTERGDLFDTIEDFRNFVEFDLETILSAPTVPAVIIKELYREVHTFKGLLNQFSFRETPLALHTLESRLDGLRQTEPALTLGDIRAAVQAVPFKALLEADLGVITEALGPNFLERRDRFVLSADQAEILERLAQQLLQGQAVDLHRPDFLGLLRELAALHTVPIGNALTSYNRLIQQTAKRLDKEVHPVSVIGGGYRIDADTYRPFLRSLVHVFRNALVHGIEDPDTRLAAGKDEVGSIICTVEPVPEGLRLSIKDDGAGIDLVSLRRNAGEPGYGYFDSGPVVTDDELLDMIFQDFVTTRRNVTDLSGRGIGLASVRSAIQALGGKVEVKTTTGQGTEFLFLLPLGQQDPALPTPPDLIQATASRLPMVKAAVIERTLSYFMTELGIRLSVEHEEQGPLAQICLHDFAAIVGLGGPIRLLIVYSFTCALAKIVTARLTNDIVIPAGQEKMYMCEAAAELINTIVGNCTADIAASGEGFSLSPPLITKDVSWDRLPGDATHQLVQLKSELGLLRIAFVWPGETADVA